MKKSLLWLLIVVMVVSMIATFSLAGCKKTEVAATTAAAETTAAAAETTAAAAETTGAPAEKVPELGTESLTYWVDKAGLKPSGELTLYSYKEEGVSEWQIAQKFMEAYPDVKVNWVTINWSDMIGTIATEVQTGTERFDMFWCDDIWLGVTQQYLEDVSDRIPEELKNDIPKQIAAGTAYKGTWHGLPLQAGTYGVNYNKDLLEQAGYDKPPETWDEFFKAAEKLTIDENSDGKPEKYGFTATAGAWSYFVLFDFIVRSTGSEFWNQDSQNPQLAFNNEHGIRALQIMKKLFRSNFSDPGMADATDTVTLARTSIASGQSAMMIEALGPIDGIAKKSFPENVGKFGYSAMPSDPEGLPGAFVSPVGFVIRKGGNVEAALAFDLFYMSPEMQKFHTAEYGFPGTRSSLVKDEEYLKEFPFVKTSLELSEGEVAGYKEGNQAILMDLFFPIFEQFINSQTTEEETLSKMEDAFKAGWEQ